MSPPVTTDRPLESFGSAAGEIINVRVYVTILDEPNR